MDSRFWPIAALGEGHLWVESGHAQPAAFDSKRDFFNAQKNRITENFVVLIFCYFIYSAHR